MCIFALCTCSENLTQKKSETILKTDISFYYFTILIAYRYHSYLFFYILYSFNSVYVHLLNSFFISPFNFGAFFVHYLFYTLWWLFKYTLRLDFYMFRRGHRRVRVSRSEELNKRV